MGDDSRLGQQVPSWCRLAKLFIARWCWLSGGLFWALAPLFFEADLALLGGIGVNTEDPHHSHHALTPVVDYRPIPM